MTPGVGYAIASLAFGIAKSMLIFCKLGMVLSINRVLALAIGVILSFASISSLSPIAAIASPINSPPVLTEDSNSLPACINTDCDCSDFQYQEDAQAVFDLESGDSHHLDGNPPNGKACDNLPSHSKVVAIPIVSPTDSDHLVLGNPTFATSDINNPNNYLIQEEEYALSYNRDKGIPNWVSWQLNQTWLGSVERQNDFRPNNALPPEWYRVKPSDYADTNYDKGHLTPSSDRTLSISDNSATFLMTNMIPQSPANNREVWRELEDYSRDLVAEGKSLYIIAGGSGEKERISDGKISVPEKTWKVIVVVDSPNFDIEKITKDSQVIAVLMPNSEAVRQTSWQDYCVSVDTVEEVTGYDFLSHIPKSIQNQIDSKVNCVIK